MTANLPASEYHHYATSLASRQEVAFVHNTLVYINRLPDDVLLMIFKQAVHMPIQGYMPIQDCINRGLLSYNKLIFAEISISRTCRRWRTLAIDSSTLWTKVYLVSRKQISSGSPYHHHSHFSRSRDRPIEIVLVDDQNEGEAYLPPRIEGISWARRCTSVTSWDRSLPHSRLFTDLLSSICPRPWSHSSEKLYAQSPCQFLVAATILFPNLRNINVEILDMQTTIRPSIPEIVDADAQLPSLTSLNLISLDLSSPDHSTIHLYTFRRFLRLVPSLTSLSLEVLRFEEATRDQPPGILHFPSLRELILRSCSGGVNSPYHGLPVFVRLMKAPDLRHFELVLPPEAASRPIHKCLDLMELHVDGTFKFPLVQSLCLLNITGLGNLQSSCTIAKRWIESFPFASEVHISPRDAGVFSEALGVCVPGYYREGPVLWPKLRHTALISPDFTGPKIPIPR